MNMLKRVFGKDERFFDLLEASADEAKNSTALLLKTLPYLGEPGSENKLEELVQTRRTHKRLRTDVTQLLCSTFVTPLEREDIDALSHALYKIPKTVEKVAARMLISPRTAKSEKVAKQISMLESAAEVVAFMVRALRKRSHVEQIRDAYERLQVIESDADKLMLDVLRELYQGEAPAKEVLILKDLFELLERAIDRCRDAGNAVFQTVLKYS
jgi:uncharacterized protein Yka (UPF0111/DUF47 family)